MNKQRRSNTQIIPTRIHPLYHSHSFSCFFSSSFSPLSRLLTLSSYSRELSLSFLAFLKKKYGQMIAGWWCGHYVCHHRGPSGRQGHHSLSLSFFLSFFLSLFLFLCFSFFSPTQRNRNRNRVALVVRPTLLTCANWRNVDWPSTNNNNCTVTSVTTTARTYAFTAACAKTRKWDWLSPRFEPI